MSSLSAADYSYLRQLVFGQSQNVLDAGRDYLFDSRLTRLLREHGMSQLEDLVRQLRSRRDPVLERAVAEAMTINETSFFRDQRPFELLRTELIPKLVENRRIARTLRLWSAACSTGQEAISLAILLRENFPQLANWNIRIDGTDITAEVVERAKAARYHRIEVNRGLPARYLVKYFLHQGEEWEVKPEIRGMCHFRQVNLCTLAPSAFERYDVIFLRNVMLYFSQDTRKTLLANIHRSLAPDGILFLGSSEQVADPSLWTAVMAGGTCFYRPKENTQPHR